MNKMETGEFTQTCEAIGMARCTKHRELTLCTCGWLVWFEKCSWVVVYGDCELKESVRNRKINLFRCNKCGFEQELASDFVYWDSKNELAIWVSPTEETILGSKPGLTPTEYMIMEEWDLPGKLVYGFDELFELLSKYEEGWD